jgi:type II secretory pathway pseudopilin PulG
MTRSARQIWSDAGARLRDEAGIGLVETLVAIIILVIGLLAVFQVFDVSTRTTFRTEQSQVATDVAQQEMERIRNLDYDQIALSSTPSHINDGNDPRERVEADAPGTRFDASNNGSLFEMVLNGGPLDAGGTIDCSGANAPCISPGPEPFTSGDVNGEIFRFVVWRNDTACSPAVCAGSQDLKRVIVAVRLDEAVVTGERPYVEVQSDFIDPDASLTSDLPSGNEVNVPQQFWLTDTTCNNSQRQAIVNNDPSPEGHRLHNTLGTCTTGLQTGSTSGAPDLLEVEPPPDPSPADPADPAIYDYATDLEPASGPDNDEGLQLVRHPTDAGCSYTGGSGGNAWERVHRWVTPTIGFYPVTSFVLTGTATLELYLRSLGGAQHDVRVCTYLFQRTSEDGGVATDVLIDTDSFLTSPQVDDVWRRYRFSLTFPAKTIAATERLGVAVSVNRNGTPADTVQFLYDHADYQSRLEVVTSTPVSE